MEKEFYKEEIKRLIEDLAHLHKDARELNLKDKLEVNYFKRKAYAKADLLRRCIDLL